MFQVSDDKAELVLKNWSIIKNKADRPEGSDMSLDDPEDYPSASGIGRYFECLASYQME